MMDMFERICLPTSLSILLLLGSVMKETWGDLKMSPSPGLSPTQPRLTLCWSVFISHLFLCISLSVHFSNTFLLFPFFCVSLSLSPGRQFYSVDDFTQGNCLALLNAWLWILWASMVYWYPRYWIYPFKERMDITSPIHFMPHIPILCLLFLKTQG